MFADRTQQLEQALLAVIASATRMGVSCDALCAEAVGGLMAEGYWKWVDPQHKDGAADEIERALSLLSSPPSGVATQQAQSIFETAQTSKTCTASAQTPQPLATSTLTPQPVATSTQTPQPV